MGATRAVGFVSGALLFILGFALLFTLVGAFFGVILMGEGAGLVALSATPPPSG